MAKCAAVFAALFFFGTALPVLSQDVTLTSRDKSVEVSGDLLGYDGEFYRVETEYGELTVDGSGVDCAGPGCPNLTSFVAELDISGAPEIGRLLLPALIEALARHHQVITFDSAGVAQSGGTVPETLEGAADIAMGLAKAIGLDKPNVLGWSMGGMTTQILAAKYGDEIGGVILAGTTPSFAIEGTIPVSDEWLGTATKEQNTPDDMQFLFYTDTDASRAAGMASLERIGGGDPIAGAASKTTGSSGLSPMPIDVVFTIVVAPSIASDARFQSTTSTFAPK